MKQRLLYPDICKFLAIFLVTCSHCAQYISGETWTNFFFGTHLDIAFNMPLFMLISGWFINLDKMREQKPLEFIWSKFKRLMIPAFVWWGILFLIQKPQSSPLSFYWYLTALFACMCIIYVFAKLIKNDTACMVLSTLLVLVCPKTDYVHINFMLPYLWSGAIINKLCNSKYDTLLFGISLALGVILSLFWKTDYSIYKSPFLIMQVNLKMIAIYIYRFFVGLSVSTVIILLLKRIENNLSYLAKFGQYSLAVYTGSFVINAVVAIVLTHIGYHTNQMFVIDALSVILCIFIYAFTVVIGNLCRKNKTTKLLFLGE